MRGSVVVCHPQSSFAFFWVIKMFLSKYNLFNNRRFDSLTVTFWDCPSNYFPLIQFWFSGFLLFWVLGFEFFSYEIFNPSNLFMAVLDLRCCSQASSSCGAQWLVLLQSPSVWGPGSSHWAMASRGECRGRAPRALVLLGDSPTALPGLILVFN